MAWAKLGGVQQFLLLKDGLLLNMITPLGTMAERSGNLMKGIIGIH